jgi:hypothetical protein
MMKRLTVSLLIGLIALLTLAMPASAGLVWYQGDPIVRLNGTETQIIAEIQSSTRGSPIVRLMSRSRHREGVERQLIFTDSEFNGYGEQVEFADFPFELRLPVVLTYITAGVPIDEEQLAEGEDVPVRLTVAPANGIPTTVMGTADRTEALIIIAGGG